MKGAGPTMVTVVLILILLFFFSVYSATLTNEANIQVAMNLQHAAELKLGNSFLLFNKSLGTTWYISGIQTLFYSNDHSLGCGEDFKYDNFLGSGYWYQYDRKEAGKKIDVANAYIAERAAGKNNKYNYETNGEKLYQPHLCYPSDENITEYLNNTFKTFVTLLPKTLTVNAVNYAVDDKNLLPIFNLPANGVQFSVQQPVAVTIGENSIKQTTLNNMTLSTELPQMFNAARIFVGDLVNIQSVFGSTLEYRPTDTRDVYLGNNRVKSVFASINDDMKVKASLSDNVKVSTTFTAADIYAAGTDDALLGLAAGRGLIFHYDIMENLSENSPDGKYYRDITTGFVKTPFSLPVKASDYLIVLTCGDNVFSTYGWSDTGSLACCGSYLFSCNANVPGLAGGQQIPLNGKIQQNLNDPTDPGSLCVDYLTKQIVQGDTHITRTLACKSDGFHTDDSQ